MVVDLNTKGNGRGERQRAQSTKSRLCWPSRAAQEAAMSSVSCVYVFVCLCVSLSGCLIMFLSTG